MGFYRAIGLETLLENDATRIGTRAQYPGDALGTGMTAVAARDGARDGGGHVAVQSRRGWLGSILCHEGDQTQRPAENSVRAACNGCARGAHLRPQHLPDVEGALTLPRGWECGGPLPKALINHHLHVCNACTSTVDCGRDEF